MAAWHETMVHLCSGVLASYRPSTHSVEEHVTQFIQDNKIDNDSDGEFLTEVFSGCVRYSKAIAVVLDGFYNRDGKNTLRSEQSTYHVLCYLTLFHLDELGVEQFRKFVQILEVNSAYKFLNFFLQEKNLLTWIKDGWNGIYDETFVQNTLLSPLLEHLPQLSEVVSYLKMKVDNKLKPKKVIIPTTDTKPFKLTQPRPRSIPLPEAIPKLQIHKPVPPTLYKASSDQTVIANRKKENRRQAEERLMEASRKQFACATAEKSHKTREVMTNIVSEQASTVDFEKHRARPVPSFLNKDIPIKMNTAAILREGQLYQKLEDEEMKKLAALEAGTKDLSEFDKWQASMRKKDLQAQLADIERKRLLGKLSYEEAILARQKVTEDNRQKVANMKKQAESLMQEYLERKLQEEQNIRNLVGETIQGHKNAKDAQKRLQEEKRKIVLQVTAENRELMKMALEEAEAYMRHKLELIHQIRAAESTPVTRQKIVDLTSTSGARLLSEMSIAELKERLSLMKVSQKEEEEKKRDEILEAKQAKGQQLIETLECISKHRLEQTRSAAIKLEEKKKGKSSELPTSDHLTSLQEHVEKRRLARLQTQEQAKSNLKPSRISAIQSSIFVGQKKRLEESRWKELEQTRERSARLASGNYECSPAAQHFQSFSTAALAS